MQIYAHKYGLDFPVYSSDDDSMLDSVDNNDPLTILINEEETENDNQEKS